MQTCRNKRKYVHTYMYIKTPSATLPRGRPSCRLADRNAEQRQGGPRQVRFVAIINDQRLTANISEAAGPQPPGWPPAVADFFFFFLIDKDDDGVVVLGTGGPGKKGKRKWNLKPALPLSMAKWSSSRCCTVLEGCEQGLEGKGIASLHSIHRLISIFFPRPRMPWSVVTILLFGNKATRRGGRLLRRHCTYLTGTGTWRFIARLPGASRPRSNGKWSL